MALAFKQIAKGKPLPVNYLPAGLGYILGAEHAPRSIFPMAEEGVYAKASAQALAAPSTLELPDAVEGPFFLGPAVSPQREETLAFGPFKNGQRGNDKGLKKVIGIIDVGIAFWAPQFLRPGAAGIESRFAGFGFVDFERGDGSQPVVVTTWDAAQMQDVVDLSQNVPVRDVFAHLAEQAPGSIYGAHAGQSIGLQPDEFAHGTAMASLAGANPSDAILLGLELPASAFFDRNGDTLQSVLIYALSAMVRMIETLDDIGAATVVLSYGFLGGPHGNDHPAVAAITRFMDQHPSITLVTPTGNHRQDQLYARPPQGRKPDETGLVWFLPPDDPTANTVEMCWRGPGVPTVFLKAPAGQHGTFAPEDDTVHEILIDGATIGAAHATRFGEHGRLRITLAPTGAKPGAARSPSGDWVLGPLPGAASVNEVECWILRDDAPDLRHFGHAPRQSWFRHPDYQKETRQGGPVLMDAQARANPVLRQGTVSALSTGQADNLFIASAEEQKGGQPETAPYSGEFKDGWIKGQNVKTVQIDTEPGIHGAQTVVNAMGMVRHVRGTSAAAALLAGAI